jgi:hypothetical protein
VLARGEADRGQVGEHVDARVRDAEATRLRVVRIRFIAEARHPAEKARTGVRALQCGGVTASALLCDGAR